MNGVDPLIVGSYRLMTVTSQTGSRWGAGSLERKASSGQVYHEGASVGTRADSTLVCWTSGEDAGASLEAQMASRWVTEE